MLLYLLGICMPPLALVLYGKIVPAAFNAIFWTYAITTPGITGIVFWLAATIHATSVIRYARTVKSL